MIVSLTLFSNTGLLSVFGTCILKAIGAGEKVRFGLLGGLGEK